MLLIVPLVHSDERTTNNIIFFGLCFIGEYWCFRTMFYLCKDSNANGYQACRGL